jgi:fermentation-respiration switch protein FrsA (DUF1100 family)
MLQAALVLARLRSHPGRSLVLVVVVGVAAGIALSALAVLRVADDPWAPLQAATRGADVEIDEAPARSDPRALAALPEVTTVGPLIQSGDTALDADGVRAQRLPGADQPTPLLIVVAALDHLTLSDLALEAYQRAREPKKLVLLPGGHFDAYVKDFETASAAARDWFLKHLGRSG